MKCFAIVVKDNKLSEAGFNELNESYKRYGYDNDLEIHQAKSKKLEKYFSFNVTR